MSKKKHHRARRATGTLSAAQAIGGYYLSPAQFGISGTDADGDNDGTTTGTTDGGGDGAGGTA